MDLQVSRHQRLQNKWSKGWKLFVCLGLLGVLWLGASARYASAAVSGDFVYVVHDNKVTITGYSGSGGEVFIPDEIEGLSVTRIGNNVFQNKQLTSVDIPKSVISIDNSAFESNQLTNVVIPEGVVTLEDTVFKNNKLISVSLPSTLEILGHSTFESNQLTNVVIPEGVVTLEDTVFNYNPLTEVVILNELARS